jgi:hypothetical protein
MKKLIAGLFFTLSILLSAPATSQFSGCSAGFCSPGDGDVDGIPISNACTNASGTTITFTAQGVGNAQPNRVSVVTLNWDDSTAAGTAQLTAATIGGISMTRAVRAATGGQSSNSEIWYASNPTGTSANIVLTFSTTVNAVTIEVYSLLGYNTVSASTTGTTSVTQAFNNKQLALAAGSRRVNVSTSLSNMTNDFSSACGANLWGVHASQKLNGNNGSLTSAISPTSNTPLIALAKWAVGSGANSCNASATFLNRTSGLDVTHLNAYTNLICGLDNDGVLTKLDTLYTFATQDQTTANLNLISSSYTIVPQSSPTWTIDRGYTGVANSTSVYLYNGFAPPTPGGGAVWTNNNASVSIWSNTAGQTTGWSNGVTGGPGNGSIFILPRDGSNQAQFNLNSIPGTIVSNTDGHGLFAVNMTSGTTLDSYINGASVGTLSTTAAAPWGGPLPFLASGNYPGQIHNGWNGQLSAASAGGALTATDHANLYTRMRAYMTAVGVP